ncbi:DNA-directed RNA polymerase III subunit RPC6 [Amblyraja radiata]|uniref:DNA-directed RNA polymerase III subunit RPC6 n=1 Tax=Amblyraja radiata TaxID=386614 RepID=UPI0014037773|nr:DNA-directed RNA polymerase III subunit RPC6 [Amblyraja radiata]
MADVKVKQETSDPAAMESRILELCQQFPQGITDQVIQNDMPQVEPQKRALVINRLLSTGQLDLLRGTAGLLYRIKDVQTASKMKGSDNQEKLVYQIIEDAGNKGIWSRDIRYKSNLPLTEINKILKNMESKKLIKAVKSVAASKKKVYMLYNLQPDRSVTGGAWYSDQDFESEFVEVLNQQCFKFLQNKADVARESKQSPMVQRNSSYASSHEVWKYICELGISKVELSMEDIETILNTLIYDGKVEITIIAAKEGTVGSVEGQMKLYRAVNPIIQPTGLMRTPCGMCPVFDDCHEGGDISPATCLYMTEWLEF